MAFRNLVQTCRVGHLLAQPTKLALRSRKPSSAPPIMTQCRHCQLVYQAREDCQKKPEVKCGSHFKTEPCEQTSQKKEKKKNTTKAAIKQQNPPAKEPQITAKRPDICCANPCKDALPRFDWLYYRRSDKLSKEYQQTWAECPELVKQSKVVCCYDKIVYPQMKKRPRQERPQTACTPPTCSNTKTTCPRFHMPRCGKVRRPPKCHVNREPKDCTKRKAPFPAFSECRRDIPKPLHPIECKCLALPTMCEVWAHYNRMRAIKAGRRC
ncbi:uncharacterized protein LOC101900597 [Musca domestica]|uniref:Uncharacterized protein LOC101900597 n=1 Tax=Musca domestica TaxID=7370 RepID=A0A1I8NHJ2_MUSDO|nr:uncharacterized protein LOC101900597 [Musca domestica]